MKHQKQFYLITIVAMSFVFFGLDFNPKTVQANSAVDSLRIKVPLACTMSGTVDSNSKHSATIQNGRYQEDIGTTSVNVICNSKDGFAVYAVGYTDDEQGNNVLTSNTVSPSYDIITGTNSSGNFSNWSMKLATNSSDTYPAEILNGFDAYSEVPSSYTKVVARDSGTDAGTGATGANFTTTYAAYIGPTQPAGKYTGQVKYILVYPSTEEPPHSIETPSGYIGYYANTWGYSGSMELQSLDESATSATLTASNYSRDGYGFAGWNDKYDYTGNYYGPNEDITFESGQYSGDNKGLSLYAVWVKSTGTIQNWTGCSSLNIGSTTALTDSRDGNTYAVAKLADNKCWSIENMRIDNSVDSRTMISESNAIGEGFDVLPPSSDNWSTNSTLVQFNNSNLVSNYLYGGYYSWSAVVASTANYSSSDETLNTSICPSGWRLPVGGKTRLDSYNDYYNLLKNITNEEPNVNADTGYGYYEGAEYSNSIRKYPNNFVYAGYWDEQTSISGSGHYWSATTYSSNNAYDFYFDTSIVRPGNAQDNKYKGQPFRCISIY